MLQNPELDPGREQQVQEWGQGPGASAVCVQPDAENLPAVPFDCGDWAEGVYK
jgi:hypothetical protein